ncbi:MAG: manganese efflux pump [Ruminococcaceae bacterium]|nr:manganese efflux pump [Oscillospiraceae bacterium]
MSLWELFLIAVSLSMDAFAVAVCKGLSLKKTTLRHCITVGLYFGVFQALMPLIGYLIASTFAAKTAEFAPYIAFALLLLIGINMIREAIKEDEEDCGCCSLSFKAMLPLAVATSIDALAVGVSFALLDTAILPSVTLIGLTTFVLSAFGVGLGHIIGLRFRKIATIVGGSVLILMGVKILLEGLGILG